MTHSNILIRATMIGCIVLAANAFLALIFEAFGLRGWSPRDLFLVFSFSLNGAYLAMVSEDLP